MIYQMGLFFPKMYCHCLLHYYSNYY